MTIRTVPIIVDQFGESPVPRFEVLIGKRDSPSHPLDLRHWMVVIGVTEHPGLSIVIPLMIMVPARNHETRRRVVSFDVKGAGGTSPHRA